MEYKQIPTDEVESSFIEVTSSPIELILCKPFIERLNSLM